MESYSDLKSILSTTTIDNMTIPYYTMQYNTNFVFI